MRKTAAGIAGFWMSEPRFEFEELPAMAGEAESKGLDESIGAQEVEGLFSGLEDVGDVGLDHSFDLIRGACVLPQSVTVVDFLTRQFAKRTDATGSGCAARG